MSFINSTGPFTPEEEPINIFEALEKENAWMQQTADMWELLASEEISDNDFYKPYVPGIKTKFRELFWFKAKITNAFILDLDDFLKYHIQLRINPSDKEAKELAEASRWSIRSWVVWEISEYMYASTMTEEQTNTKQQKIREATAKIDEFYAWMFQNIPLKPQSSQDIDDSE